MRRQWMALLVVVAATASAASLLLAALQSTPLQRGPLPRFVSMGGARAVPLACARSRLASRPGSVDGPPVQVRVLARE